MIFAQMLRLGKVDCWSCSSLRMKNMVQIMPPHASSALIMRSLNIGVSALFRAMIVTKVVVLG